MKNRCFRLRHRPSGTIKQTDLELCEEELPPLEDGQVLVQTLVVSIDPTHRIWMSDRLQYMPAVELGDVMRALGMGKVVESKSADFAVGDFVSGITGVQEYAQGPPDQLMFAKLPDASTQNLSVCSIVIGLTAWHGAVKILEAGPDDVVVVSGAAGAVGSLVVQLCKLRGAKVCGIAGGPAKCKFLTDDLGLDAAIDYKSDDVDAKLKEFAPDGITGYFDNVGGTITETVMNNMRNFSTLALCGSISEYNDEWTGIRNFNMILMRRIRVQGFICIDHVADEYADCLAELTKLVSENKLKYREHVEDGLENYVDVLNMLFEGKNTGKLMLRVASD